MLPAFDLLASPTRLRILELIWDQELRAGAIAAGSLVTFGAVSQQLKRLREGGLVTERRQGRQRLYRANRAGLGPLATVLQSMWQSNLFHLKALAEAEDSFDDEC